MIDRILCKFNSFALGTRGLTTENLWLRSKKEIFYSPDSTTLVVGIPSWGENLGKWSNIKKILKQSNISFIIYEFPREILSDNSPLTIEIFQNINKTVREDIKILKSKYNFRKCIMIGSSLGSAYGSMIYKENPDISSIIFVCPGNNIAQNLWTGLRTQHLRKSYQKQGFNLVKLKKDWHDLSSENNMPDINTTFYLYYGKTDQIAPYLDSKTLTTTLKAHGIKVIEKDFYAGHYILLIRFLLFPKKFLKDALVNN